jgi:hypothetical protein
MVLDPFELVEFMESMPAIVENWRSRTVATVVAMVSGLAPGNEADTVMVGRSTLGMSLMGNCVNPNTQKTRIANITNVVMTGRRMKMAEMFTLLDSSLSLFCRRSCTSGGLHPF